MAISDSKKCQTLINACAQEAQRIKVAATRLEAIRALYVAASPDPTGTALDGNVPAVSAWIDAVRATADGAVPDGMIAARVPSHRGEAL